MRNAGRSVDVNLGIFAINLDRSPDRWERVVSQFSEQPWPLHRVAAIDGRDRDTTLAYRGLTAAHPDGAGWSITRLRLVSFAEEACFCSHLKALREFLASDHSHAMILEDDVVGAEPGRSGDDSAEALSRGLPDRKIEVRAEVGGAAEKAFGCRCIGVASVHLALQRLELLQGQVTRAALRRRAGADARDRRPRARR